MNFKNVTAQSEWQKKICPYCHEKLGVWERLARRAKLPCKCKKCKSGINERFIIR